MRKTNQANGKALARPSTGLRSAACLLLSISLMASAQQLTVDDEVEGMTPEDTAVLYRQSVFYLMQTQMNQLKRLIVKEAAADRESIATIAQQLHQTAALTGYAFGEYAAMGFDIPTTAAASIWENPDGFADAVNYLQESAAELATVADMTAAADAAQLKAALIGVGKSCKACHEDFRSK